MIGKNRKFCKSVPCPHSQIHGVWVEVKANGSDPDSWHFLCNSRASGFVYARYG